MEKFLKIKYLNKELCNNLISIDDKLSIEDNSINKFSLECMCEDLFGQITSLGSKEAFVNIFYDFIENNKNESKLKQLYMVDKSKVISRIKSSKQIFDTCDLILEDMYKVFNLDKKTQSINIIGGKIVDLLLGKDLSESTGDFDVWFSCPLNGENISLNHLNFEYERVEDSNPSCQSYLAIISKDITIKVQIIYKTYETVEDILAGFDFLHCCVGYDGKNFFWRNGALKAIKYRSIIINDISSSHVANERLHKYINRGFNITYPNLILLSINTLLSLMKSNVLISNNSFGWNNTNNLDNLLELRSSGGY